MIARMLNERKILLEDISPKGVVLKYFSGNKWGKKSCNVIIPEDFAMMLHEDRHIRVTNFGDETYPPSIKAIINFDSFNPPNVIVNNAGVETTLDDRTISRLDKADVESWHMTLGVGRPGDDGFSSLYLDTMYVYLADNYLLRKHGLTYKKDSEVTGFVGREDV